MLAEYMKDLAENTYVALHRVQLSQSLSHYKLCCFSRSIIPHTELMAHVPVNGTEMTIRN